MDWYGKVVYFHCASPQTTKRWAPWARRIARGVQGGCLAFETIRDHRRWHRAGRPFTLPPPITKKPDYYRGDVVFDNVTKAESLKVLYPWAERIVRFPYDNGYMVFSKEGDLDWWRDDGFPRFRLEGR